MLNENKKCITAFRWSNNNQICHQAPITIPHYGCFISNITFLFYFNKYIVFGRKKYRWRSNATLKNKKDMKIIIWDCRERERERERGHWSNSIEGPSTSTGNSGLKISKTPTLVQEVEPQHPPQKYHFEHTPSYKEFICVELKFFVPRKL